MSIFNPNNMKICKIFTFDAAHKLPDEECYGACRNMHGHTYKMEVEIEGPINEKGWVINFKDLKKIVNKYVDHLDHSLLNDHFDVPTAELMALNLAGKINIDLQEIDLKISLSRLTLWETPTCSTTVTKEDL